MAKSSRASAQPEPEESRLPTNLALLALPCLSFAAGMLGMVRKDLEDEMQKRNNDQPGYMKSIENLVASEVHALMMIFDRSHTLRKLVGQELEEKIVAEFAHVSKSIVSGSIIAIEAQEAVLKRVVELVREKKEGGGA